jgi:S-DNA-T family DNA segregation ATPase FtsK/SpoIIIE
MFLALSLQFRERAKLSSSHLYESCKSRFCHSRLFLIFLMGTYRSTLGKMINGFLKDLRSFPKLIASSVSRVFRDKTLIQLMPKLSSLRSFMHVGLTRLLRRQNDVKTPLEKKVYTPLIEDSSPMTNGDARTDKQVEIEEKKIIDMEEIVEAKKPVERSEISKALRLKKTKAKEDGAYYNLVAKRPSSKKTIKVKHPDQAYFDKIVERIEDKLNEFKIDGQIINILKGPVVDTFELELGTGVKVSKVTGSTEDLSLALYGAPIRVVYPMKGRTTVGIEVPRNPREIIYLDEILGSRGFHQSKSRLPLAMGKDAFGEPFIVDLASMPHMLVAGATGAGKSVFINTLLVSLLVKKSPRQMKLILIDPKQLELALYAKLPHLIMPVVTDAKTASLSLLWAVQEMERRYSILKEFGVRNIEGFNQKLKEATPEMLASIHRHYEHSDAEEYELPYLVVIIDEFADLILTKAGKEIENNVCRLAAKARAAGVHLVVATQRPSVDVITGLIKSNFPTRVSFRVTTNVDSRTILNATGAERLLGKGDMLYKHGVETHRVHSSYVDEKEIELLTDSLSDIDCQFDSQAMEFLENGGELEQDPYAFGSHISSVRNDDSSEDDLYDQAVNLVLESRSASASMLQRRLKIGYNRAANLVEEMETKGIVGPAQGSRPRKVLSSLESPPN